MTELLQRSRIERAQELDVVCVDAILRHERNGLKVGVEELHRTFAHLLAVLHAHIHSLRRVQGFVAVNLVAILLKRSAVWLTLLNVSSMPIEVGTP